MKNKELHKDLIELVKSEKIKSNKYYKGKPKMSKEAVEAAIEFSKRKTAGIEKLNLA
jgi:hypothetical protein